MAFAITSIESISLLPQNTGCHVKFQFSITHFWEPKDTVDLSRVVIIQTCKSAGSHNFIPSN